jgi:hypothetical protein
MPDDLVGVKNFNLSQRWKYLANFGCHKSGCGVRGARCEVRGARKHETIIYPAANNQQHATSILN